MAFGRMVPSLDHRPGGPARASAGIQGSSGVRRTRVVHLSKLQITVSDWLYLQVQAIAVNAVTDILRALQHKDGVHLIS